MNNRNTTPHAFTLVELLVLIAIVAILAAIQFPALANTKGKVQRVNCSDNLKRIGVAFRTWSGSHNSRMPMSTSSFQGGALEAVGVRATDATFASNMTPRKGVFGIFAVMSNELVTPKILYCPSEYRANIAQGTVFGDESGGNAGFFNDNGTSYFIGVDANDILPNMFLTGDHNLGDTFSPPNAATIYGDGKGNFVSAGTNINWLATSIGWGDNQHRRQGNVALADGSVQNFNSPMLRAALNKTGDSARSPGVFAQSVGSFGTGMNRLQFP